MMSIIIINLPDKSFERSKGPCNNSMHSYKENKKLVCPLRESFYTRIKYIIEPTTRV